jgi:hypothetical protein
MDPTHLRSCCYLQCFQNSDVTHRETCQLLQFVWQVALWDLPSEPEHVMCEVSN